MPTEHGMNKACLGVGVGEFVGVLVVAEWPGDNIDRPHLEQGLASKCCWARAALCCGCTGSEIGGRGSQQGHTVTTVILTCTWDLDFGVRGPWLPRVSTNWAGCHFDRRPGEPGLLWNSWLGLEPLVACAGSGADVDGRRDEQGLLWNAVHDSMHHSGSVVPAGQAATDNGMSEARHYVYQNGVRARAGTISPPLLQCRLWETSLTGNPLDF